MTAVDPGVLHEAPALAGPVLFDQVWADLAFLHWPVAPSVVAPLLPAGVRPDVVDGVTWAGLVPFHMRRAGPGRGHATPWLGDFLETNVRLYGVDDAGRHGVVFRSLECQRLFVVLAARLGLGIPYTWARMSVSTDRGTGAVTGSEWAWESRRRWPRVASSGGFRTGRPRTAVRVRVGERIDEPSELDRWLTCRWGLHHRIAGRTWWTPNEHGPWPLWDAEVLDLDDELVAAAGLPVDGPPPHVRFTPGVRTQFSWPRRLAGPRSAR